MQLIITILAVTGIGFWSFSGKDTPFFGNPTIEEINIESEVDVDSDFDMQSPGVHLHSGVNNSKNVHDEAPSMIILIVVTAILATILPSMRWYGQ